ASTATSSGHSILGPAVRSLLIQYDISQKDLKPTGPKGNLLKT
nr:E3BP, p45=dihydrolipoyl dehydrogenase-binding protein/pyruvate dehydrogenase complex subunit {N-terminal} [Ascaris suum, muscle, Peptide Partial, 42 aa] [Ascaris suum]